MSAFLGGCHPPRSPERYPWPRIERNQWHHIAVTGNNIECVFYVDGILFADGKFYEEDVYYGDSFRGAIPARAPLRIARGSGEIGHYFSGELAEVRIWNVAGWHGDDTRIEDNVFERLSGSEPGLVAYWQLDGPVGQVLPDVTGHGHDAHRDPGRVP